MKLTYWIAPNLQGIRTESVIGRSRHDCEQQVLAYCCHDSCGPPVKKTLIYTDVFDLFEKVTGPDAGRGME